MTKLDKEFWDDRYKNQQTGWDIGYPSTPLKKYFDQLTNKDLKILIPGCGNAYEASYLFHQGYKNIYLLDVAAAPLQAFQQKVSDFPRSQLIQKDFFEYTNSFDLIIEQTFFCALHPDRRRDYVKHMNTLLKDGGKLTGLFFSTIFSAQGPPFGGTKDEYEKLFSKDFHIKILENYYNSIPPRMGNELFFIFEKK